DKIKETQVIATGSSSFELANKINEPLTGRKFEFLLLPFSYEELFNNFGFIHQQSSLAQRLIFGSYPEVINKPGTEASTLKILSENYLYKDILSWDNIRKPEHLEKLVKALAFQVGNQVSYNELGNLTGLDNETDEKYLVMLERGFIIFRLNSFSRNLRNEIKRSRKIYFYDNGIRNAIINNFNSLEFRNDIGQLWENFLVSERLKRNIANKHFCNTYFWRNHYQQEIDYLEEFGGKINIYEFKWKEGKNYNFPSSFLESYDINESSIIHNANYHDFLINPGT
ncbi:MAG: DUF4143 domain-containing protein, partial [Flavobacterium sp.]|nr:DUF4143 domain-containing protein [Flavobacterium sp.]